MKDDDPDAAARAERDAAEARRHCRRCNGQGSVAIVSEDGVDCVPCSACQPKQQPGADVLRWPKGGGR